LIKNKNWFLITADYTTLYLQYTYMAARIYKCFYKSEATQSQMREYFVAGFLEQMKVPEIQVMVGYR
jgi:hypothetical protein